MNNGNEPDLIIYDESTWCNNPMWDYLYPSKLQLETLEIENRLKEESNE